MGNKGTRLPAEPLTAAEVGLLLGECSRGPSGLRNQALIAIMYRAGLRCEEMLSLKVSDVDAEKGTVRVLHGKGNRARVTGTDAGTFAIVQRWIDVRVSLGITDGPLFCTLRGGPLGSRYVRELMTRLGRHASIGKRTHCHGLRHTHASELVAEHVPLNVISKQLGHSNSNVTARYLDHVAPAQVIDMGRARPGWAA